MTIPMAEQMGRLKRGAVEIYSEKELSERLAQAAAEQRPLRVKLGLDPTSPDIHLGHTVVLRKMRQFQDLGHQAVLIIGDYTAQIGDPTGQDNTRPMLDAEQIRTNAQTYFKQASKILDTHEDKLELRYNSEWLAPLSLMEMIQLAGKKTVAQMLQRDSFKKRLQNDIDVYTHEFLYPLLQGYDSYAIAADVELGGTDQTFNNLVGRDIQRAYGQKQQIVITMPILVGLDGVEKMSKSKGNYIGVTDAANDMFGKVMSLADAMMENYYTLLTDEPRDAIQTLVRADKTHPKEAKVQLGKSIVTQFHDGNAARAAAEHFDRVFRQNETPEDMPVVTLSAEPLMAAKLLLSCNLVESGGEGKRLVKQGGVSVDGRKVTDPNEEIVPADGMVVQVGKRRFAKLAVK